MCEERDCGGFIESKEYIDSFPAGNQSADWDGLRFQKDGRNRFEREMRNNAISGLEKMGVQVSPDIFEVVPSPIYMLEVERIPMLKPERFRHFLAHP